MENQNDQAIENAAGQAEIISEIDAVATENQPGHIIPMVDIIDGGDNDINDPRKVTLNCVVEDCNFQTSKCDTEEVACQLLIMHADLKHKTQQESGKIRGSNKIWLPETLDLDPADDNGEVYQF